MVKIRTGAWPVASKRFIQPPTYILFVADSSSWAALHHCRVVHWPQKYLWMTTAFIGVNRLQSFAARAFWYSWILRRIDRGRCSQFRVVLWLSYQQGIHNVSQSGYICIFRAFEGDGWTFAWTEDWFLMAKPQTFAQSIRRTLVRNQGSFLQHRIFRILNWSCSRCKVSESPPFWTVAW